MTLSNCPLNPFQGSGWVITQVTDGLRNLGHEVILLGPDEFTPFEFVKKGKRYRQALGMLVRTVWELMKNRFDLIMFYGGESWLALWFLQTFLPGKATYVVHSNGLEPHLEEAYALQNIPFYGSGLLPFPVEIAYRNADGLIVVSQYEAEFAKRRQYQRDDKLLQLENGIAGEYLESRTISRRDVPTNVITFCGSWLPIKGIGALGKAVTRLLDKYPEIRFKIIGCGSDTEVLSGFPERLQKRIDIIPEIHLRERLRDEFHTSDILIVPSYYESFGLVTAEAMACGCAVIASNTGFAAALEHRVHLYKLPEIASPAIVTAVEFLYSDFDSCRRMAEEGQRIVQRLDWSKLIPELEATLIGWVSGKKEKSSL